MEQFKKRSDAIKMVYACELDKETGIKILMAVGMSYQEAVWACPTFLQEV